MIINNISKIQCDNCNKQKYIAPRNLCEVNEYYVLNRRSSYFFCEVDKSGNNECHKVEPSNDLHFCCLNCLKEYVNGLVSLEEKENSIFLNMQKTNITILNANLPPAEEKNTENYKKVLEESKDLIQNTIIPLLSAEKNEQ